FIRTNNGTEFVNHVLTAFYESVGISYQKSVPRTPQQNSFVERRNRSLIEVARTMMIFSKALMFLWAKAFATTLFGALCYPTNDSEDLRKLQPKVDIGIFLGYAPKRKGYIIYNKRTQRIMETFHVEVDELTEQMASMHIDTRPKPTLLPPGPISLGLVPNPVPAPPFVSPTNKELEILFQSMFDDYFEPLSVEIPVPPTPAVQVPVVSAGTPSSTTIDQDAPSTSNSPSSLEEQPPVVHQGVARLSSGVVSCKTQLVHLPHTHLTKWTKDHPIDNIVGNPSHMVSTRKQLATDALWCLYHSVLSKVEPKNFKTAMTKAC
ncbi:integrase, catalytic region, zinc finger, CCHC-type containing protein, partial [Tanacetum coccineum]